MSAAGPSQGASPLLRRGEAHAQRAATGEVSL
jgi:hypothetical protein